MSEPHLRVLFVDDEPLVLAGLRDLLRSRRRDWDMRFVGSGREALAALEATPMDVVVSDMRMPGMDGATLLREVQRRWPRAVRIILSGHTELEAAVRTVPIAHQFLSKPCEAARLSEIIERACRLQSLLHDDRLRHAIGGATSLPSAPGVYRKLTEALMDLEVPMTRVAAIIEADPAMCARVLQITNSAFFGLPRKVVNVREAVGYLGVNLIKNLSLTVEAFGTLHGRDLAPGFDVTEFHRHSGLTARIARGLVRGPEATDAFTAGMLHEIGQLVFATRDPQRYGEVLAVARRTGAPISDVERAHLGATHGEAGAYLLGLWGLPYGIVEAVAWLHREDRPRPETFGVSEAVTLACLLAREAVGGPLLVLPRWATDLGLSGRLSAWRVLAADEASKPEV